MLPPAGENYELQHIKKTSYCTIELCLIFSYFAYPSANVSKFGQIVWSWSLSRGYMESYFWLCVYTHKCEICTITIHYYWWSYIYYIKLFIGFPFLSHCNLYYIFFNLLTFSLLRWFISPPRSPTWCWSSSSSEESHSPVLQMAYFILLHQNGRNLMMLRY